MERVFNIVRAEDEGDKNISFWNSKTPEERLSAVQTLREQHIILFNKQNEYFESREGLRRVYRVTEQKKS